MTQLSFLSPDTPQRIPRMDPPSVPVASSERGAEIAKHRAPSQCDRILVTLLAAGATFGSPVYLSRDDLLARIPGLTVNAATGRLGPSGPLLVAKGEDPERSVFSVHAVEDAARSGSGNAVKGYQLTPRGVDHARWLARRGEAA